jgi:hypothetical protein
MKKLEVNGYADLYMNIASAVRLELFAQRLDSYILEENPAGLEYEQRAMISRKISDMVAEEVKPDAYELAIFAAAVVKAYPPPPMEEESGD